MIRTFTKTGLTLVTAVIAASTLASTANAGIRLGFGFPLGGFVARPFQSSSAGGGYGQKHCDERAAARRAASARYAAARREEAARRQAAAVAEAKAEKAKRLQLAEAARLRRLEKEKEVVIKTAVVETTSTTVGAPAVIVPETPAPAPVTTASVSTETPAVTTTTTTTAPAVKVDEPKVEKTEKVVAEPATRKVEITSAAKRICRKFSAAIGGLVDIPCE